MAAMLGAARVQARTDDGNSAAVHALKNIFAPDRLSALERPARSLLKKRRLNASRVQLQVEVLYTLYNV
jgi:hypothetical protein